MIRLRSYRPDDRAFFVALMASPQAMAWLEGAKPQAQAHALFDRLLAERGQMAAGLLLGPDGRAIGHGYLRHLSPGSEAELGLVLTPEMWGQGYGTEAVRRLLELALVGHGCRRVISTVEPGHGASCRMLEKAGMACRTQLQDRSGSYLLYEYRAE
ncbi:GNAT family N-acetyltransferase [Ferrimonas pelagia]|uniref:N-acetyltransferase domain-containing protein n=1 Tax=Ferrimonas pelagia TaxID=1177826 RepID=A0ABP9EIM4_9GAMM